MKIDQQKFQQIIKEEILLEQRARDVLTLIETLETAGYNNQQIEKVLLRDFEVLHEDLMGMMKSIFTPDLSKQFGGIGKFLGSGELLSSIKSTAIESIAEPIITNVFNLNKSNPLSRVMVKFVSDLVSHMSFTDWQDLISGKFKCKNVVDKSFASAMGSLIKTTAEIIQNSLFPTGTPVTGLFAQFGANALGETLKKMILGNPALFGTIKKEVTETICEYVKKEDFTNLVKKSVTGMIS